MSKQKLKQAIGIIEQHREMADFHGAKAESLIVLAEKALNLTFPEDYKFFLKELGCGDIAGQEFFGIIDSDFINSSIPDAVWITLQERLESKLPDNYVLIGETGDGAYFALDCNISIDKKVVLWNPGLLNTKNAFTPYYEDFGHYFYDRITNAISA